MICYRPRREENEAPDFTPEAISGSKIMSGLHFSRKGSVLHDFSRQFQTDIGSHLYNSLSLPG